MEESILKSTKKVLGIAADDTSFDLDVITFINSAFSNLHQLGIGLPEGFAIEDDSLTWEEFITGFPEFEPYISMIKTLVYLRVRVLFDPPATSFHQQAMENQIQEREARLSMAREAAQWVDPLPEPEPVPDIIDGGDAL